MSKATDKFSPEVGERAVRIIGEHRVDCGSSVHCIVFRRMAGCQRAGMSGQGGPI